MRKLLFIPLLIFAVGCGQGTFTEIRKDVQSDVLKKEVNTASVEKFKKIEGYKNFQNKLFNYLNLASLHFYSQQLDSSIYYFNLAESRIEEQYTRRVSQEVGSILTNQYNVDYQSYPVEHLMIHFYKSLAFLQKNDLDGAIVEVRKLQQKLSYLDQFSGFYKIKQTDYPFLNYYSGMVFHLAGDDNAARVSFKLANYDYDSLKEKLPSSKQTNLHITFSGMIPELNEAYIRLLVNTDDDIYTLKVAYPVYFDTFSNPDVKDSGSETGQHKFDVAGKFETEFNAKEKELQPKNFARVAAKFILANGTAAVSEKMMEKRKEEKEKEKEEKKKKGEKVDDNSTNGEDIFWGSLWVLGNVMKVVNDVTEKADLRQWFLLPSTIYLSVDSSKPDSTHSTLFQSEKLTLDYLLPKRVRVFNEEQYQQTIDFNFDNQDNRNDGGNRRRDDRRKKKLVAIDEDE